MPLTLRRTANEERRARAEGRWAFLALALSLIVPSIGAVQKYLGTAGLATYGVVVVVALVVGYFYILPWFLSAVSERLSTWLAVATILGLLVVFAVVYPIANSGIVGGGTDRDEALNIAVGELVHGRYPYYLKTYLGAPISPLPGSILLAMPFVLLGNSAYQNLFWIAAFYMLIRACFKDGRMALLLCWMVLALSPLFWQEFVTGGDLLANSLFVSIFTLWMVQLHIRPAEPAWKKAAAAILLGVGLASRPNYLLVLLPVYFLIRRSAGWRTAIGYTAIVCLVAAGITLPFYFYDPAGFSPLHTLNKVNQFQSLLPFASAAILASSGLIGLLLALRLRRDDLAGFLLACAVPQAVPIIVGLVFYLVRGRLDYTFPGYGFSFLWFGVLAAWLQMIRTDVLYLRPDAMESASPALR
jgi:hypothetical protein